MGGGNPVGGNAQGDRGEDAALDPRSGFGPELEVAGSGGHCRAVGSASAAVGRGYDHGRNGDRKCCARNSESPQSTEKLLVAVGGHGAGDVVHDAAPSGSDIERACRRIGIRRNTPIKEQHPSSGSGRSVPIVLSFCVAENRPAMPFCVYGLPQTSAAMHSQCRSWVATYLFSPSADLRPLLVQ